MGWLNRPKKVTCLIDHTQGFLGWNGGKRAMSWHVTENLKKLKKENQDGKSWVTIKELQMVTQSIHQLMENSIDGRRGEYHSIKEGEHGVVEHSWLLSKGMVDYPLVLFSPPRVFLLIQCVLGCDSQQKKGCQRKLLLSNSPQLQH